jgi:hypothetical protein
MDTRFLISIGFFLRLIVSIWNGFFEFSLGQSADPGSLHGYAVLFSLNPTVSNCEENIRHVMSCGLGFVYLLTTDSRFIGSLMSNLAWLVSTLILMKIMSILLVEKSNQKKIMLVYALLPSSIIVTSVTLREPYQLLLVNLAVLAALKIYWNKSYMHWLTMLFSVYFMSILHGGLMVFGIYILASTLILLARRRYKKGFNKIKLVFAVPIIILLVPIGVEVFINSGKGYGNLRDGLAAGIETYQKGGISTALTARSRGTYRDTVDLKNDSDLIFFIPTALFQYLFEPMPWQVSRPKDIALLLENLLRAYLIWKGWTGLRRESGKMKNAMLFIFISYFAIEVIWAQGTMNWGTAARHHIPGLGLLVLFAFAYSKSARLRPRPLTPVNPGMTSEN